MTIKETNTPLRRGPYRAGLRRREEILAAAISVFGRRGFAGGSVRSIAERVGISHATLLQHFGTKEGLLTAVLEEWDRRAAVEQLADVSGLAYFRRIPRVMAAHVEDSGMLELFTLMAAEGTSESHPAHSFIRARYRGNLDTLARQLQIAIDRGDVGPMSAEEVIVEMRLLTAVLDGIGLQWLLDPTTDMSYATSLYIERAIGTWKTR